MDTKQSANLVFYVNGKNRNKLLITNQIDYNYNRKRE